MIVETKNGLIRGIEKQSVAGGKKYFSYLGVPYAKPPVGELRFAPPQPVEDWNGTHDATYERERCYQDDVLGGTGVSGSEDCLYLNIHTPDVNSATLKPVLFYIHGGGFICGSGDEPTYGADYMINYDVVVITVNYRIHVLGFLNMGIPECPGNAGLKDQVMALRWIKENIKAFGGDPDNVTISGCSSGASSVNLQMISPLSQGLFHKAVMQGGTALSPWGYCHDPVQWALEAGKILGCKKTDRLEVVKFCRSLPVEQLSAYFAFKTRELLAVFQKPHLSSGCLIDSSNLQRKTLRDTARGSYNPVGPSVEEIKEGAFLPDIPENLAKTARPVPCIAGRTEVERVYWNRYFLMRLPFASESLVKDIVEANFIVNKIQLKRIDAELRQFYFQQNDQSKSNLNKIDELLSDLCCLRFYDALEFVTNSDVPLYMYYFTYFSERCNRERRKVASVWPMSKKTFHGEDNRFIMADKKFGDAPFKESNDIQVQKNMSQLWANFMKTGHPTCEGLKVDWKPSTTEEPCYLQIDKRLNLKNGKIVQDRMDFLKSVLRDVKFRIIKTENVIYRK